MPCFPDRVTELFSATTSLISQFRDARKGKHPLHEQIVDLKNRIRESVDQIMDFDIEFAQQKDLEGIFWKEVFYRLLDDYQKHLKKSSADAHASRVKDRQLLQAYLEETFGFYIRLLHRIAAHYRLDVFGDSTDTSILSTPKQRTPVRSQGIAMSFKCLLHLGDIARYREQYSELPRKDYTGAIRYYERAQRLIPQNGNPHNQLAVVSTYKNDKISALYHYYRAITCDDPFPVAKKNVALLFEMNAAAKAASAPKTRNDDTGSISHDPQIFATEYLNLHASLFLEKNFKDVPALQASVVEKFSALLRNGALSVNQCLKLSMVNIAAYHLTKESQPNAEPFACALLMEMFFVISMEAEQALGDSSGRNSSATRNGNSRGPMQQNLTLQLPIRARRMLPAIYLLAKFIRLDPELAEFKHSASFVQVISRGWKAYANVIKEIRTLLSVTMDSLVPLVGDRLLEEDIACLGFAPMLSSSDGASKNITADACNMRKPLSGFAEWPIRLSNMVTDAMSIDVPVVRALFNDRSEDAQGLPRSVELDVAETARSAPLESPKLSTRNSPTSRQTQELQTDIETLSQSPPAVDEGSDDDEEVILLSLPSRRRQVDGDVSSGSSITEAKSSMPAQCFPPSAKHSENIDCDQPTKSERTINAEILRCDSNFERSLSPPYNWAYFDDDGTKGGECPSADELIDADDAAIREMVQDIVDVDNHEATAVLDKTDDYSLRLWNAIPKGLLEESPAPDPATSNNLVHTSDLKVTIPFSAPRYPGVINTAVAGSTSSQSQGLDYSMANETGNYSSLFSHASSTGMTAPLSPALWQSFGPPGFFNRFPSPSQSPTTGFPSSGCGPTHAAPGSDAFPAFNRIDGGQYHNFGFPYGHPDAALSIPYSSGTTTSSISPQSLPVTGSSYPSSNNDFQSTPTSSSPCLPAMHGQQTLFGIDPVPWFGTQPSADVSPTTEKFSPCLSSLRSGGGRLSESVIGEERKVPVRGRHSAASFSTLLPTF